VGAAANSANRRVLVTHADGRQTVEEIQNDLGLAADDTPGMIARLRAQNTNASNVALFGTGEYGTAKSRKPDSSSNQVRETRKKVLENAFSSNIMFGDAPPRSSKAAPEPPSIKVNQLIHFMFVHINCNLDYLE
jgi:hypothetical protein